MYSKLEEASFPLVSDRQHVGTKFTKAGTFNPSKIIKHAPTQSFFVWKLSDQLFEIHEITSSKQLQHNRFTYDFAVHQIENDPRSRFYLHPHVECIEYHDNGQNMIAFHLLTSNWTLYQFKVIHPQQWNEYNQNLSVLQHLQQTQPSAIQLLPFIHHSGTNPPLSFKMFDLTKILLCSSTQLMMIHCNAQDGGNEPFMIDKKENPKSLFSSFLPSALSAAPTTECNYVFMSYHKPVASRTIIGCLDNKCHFELYLLSNHKRIDHKTLEIGTPQLQNAHHLLFYGYRHEYGVCWFSVLLFYENGGGGVLQCQYKQNEDELVILNEFEPLNGIHNATCIDAQIHNNLLWCVLLNNNSNDREEYDVFFCDIRHYVNNRNTVNAENWKFQRMWKRSEYIHRILNSIQTEFSFDTFYEQCAREWNHVLATNIGAYKHKLHELILNFWLKRLVDDPTLEFNNEILESQLKQLVVSEQMEHHYHSHWNNIPDIAAFGVLDDSNNDDDDSKYNAQNTDNNNNATMTRIKFESQLQSLMIAIMDKKYPSSHHDIEQLQSKHYIKYVWSEYNSFFLNCLEKAKQFKRFMALSCVLHDSVIIIKENGVSAIRDMDYSEQIEVYFDRYRDESDELNDFSEPPMRLHKFIGFCHNNGNHRNNNIYHWFVACTWFYYQNSSVFSDLEDKDIISNTFATYFHEFIAKHKQEIKHHTKKQLMRLYQIQQHDEFLRDIILLFNKSYKSSKNKQQIVEEIWNETGLMSCIESSFASIVAARYSLLRSVYITVLYLRQEEKQPFKSKSLLSSLPPRNGNDNMEQLADLLKGYFVLSYLSSSVYETKQYLGIYNTNYGPFREELLSHLQSSFRSGLAVSHYLRYKESKMTSLYFKSPLYFTVELINNIFNTNHVDLVYAVIEFMFIERQFEALQKIVSFVHYISPLFKYLLARCHIEMDQLQMKSNCKPQEDANAFEVQLMNECVKDLQDDNRQMRMTENDKYLLGFILTDELLITHGGDASSGSSVQYETVDIYHLAPRDCIEFPLRFVRSKEKEAEKAKERMVLSSNVSETQPEYEWCIVLSFYFHIIKLYKRVLPKPQLVIKFAKNGIQLIKKEMRNMAVDDIDVDNRDEIVERVRRYSGINSKRARKLCVQLNYNLEAILLSIYKSHFLLEIVFESLKMEQYPAAYQYLIQFDDLFCAKQGIKAYVSSCCKNKQMEPILSHEWNESEIQFTEWRKYLLSFKKSNNIWMRTLNYKCLVELIIYNFALQFNMEDSFCFDLLYTFAMNHKQYRSAAKYMFEYAVRIEQYIRHKTASSTKLQFHCLCHVLSAMDLLPGPNAKKYLFLDFAIADDTFNFCIQSLKNIVTYKQIKQYYIFIESKNYLLSSSCFKSIKPEIVADLNVQQTANELYRNGFYSQSLLLLDVFDADLQFIFDKMVQTLLFGDDIDHSTRLTWHKFEILLLDYDEDDSDHYKYTLNSLQTILSFYNNNQQFILPSFVYNKMEELNEDHHENQIDIFIVPLCQLLLQSGQILCAIEILNWAFNKTQISIRNNNYNYQNHSFWKIVHKIYAYCKTLELKEEGNKLIKAAANWIARPCAPIHH